MLFSYNWLKWYIPDAPSKEELASLLTCHLTEVEGLQDLPDGDTVIDVNILPNRAGDLLSHKGLALEISGQLGLKFVEPYSKYESMLAKKQINKTNLKIESSSPAVRRYSARIIRNIKIGPSPDWVQKHLESIGQRSINNIVDATNLLMFNCGQPAHAFDLRNFKDEKIVLTNAKDGTELELVGKDKIVAILKDSDLIVSDSSGSPMALVGIKGGTNSGIQDDTTDIILEVGNFEPAVIRKTARRIGVLTDAAKRFENDVTPELCSYGMLELTALISEMCPDAVIEEIVDYYPNKEEQNNISFTSDLVNKKLGSNIKDSDIEKILKNYKYEYKFESGIFDVTPPVFRRDLQNPVDMIEEIGRVYGYDKVIPVMPKLDFISSQNEQHKKIEEIRSSLVFTGYRETMTYSFCKKGDLQVARGSKGKDFLRTNLLDGLKESYELNKNNAPLLGLNEVKIFEIGSVFPNGNEEIHVAYINKKESKEFKVDDFNAFNASSDSKIFGPRVTTPAAKISAVDSASNFLPWSQYPFITRDIAVWVPADFDKKILENIYNSAGKDLLSLPAYLVDEFSKNDKKSYAYRLVFQSKERTLESDEISEIVEKINQELQKISGLELR